MEPQEEVKDNERLILIDKGIPIPFDLQKKMV